MRIQRVTDELATTLNLGGNRGALIVEVFSDGPSQKAGIEVSDVALSFDGKPIRVLQTKVTTPADVAAALAALRREGRRIALMTVAKPNGRAIFRALPME